jgi:alkyl sulfatase BDS1-like metallo-beta-lactamase superfamily hydrolase
MGGVRAMSTHRDPPQTVTVDGATLDDAVCWLELMEDFLLFRDEADVLAAHHGHPGATAERLAEWVGTTAAYLRRTLRETRP